MPFKRLLHTLADMTMETGGKETASFQYIITTTTPSDEKLIPFECVRLAGNPKEALLFGCVLALPEQLGLLV